jgi:hypothetical protein
MTCKIADLNVLNLMQCKYDIITRDPNKRYFTIPAEPATGLLFVTQNNPQFISGQIRVRGRNNGSYPYNYLEMIDALFGKEPNTIEVMSQRFRIRIRLTGLDCLYNLLIQMAQKMNIGDALPQLSQSLQEEEKMSGWLRANAPAMFAKLWPQIESST